MPRSVHPTLPPDMNVERDKMVLRYVAPKQNRDGAVEFGYHFAVGSQTAGTTLKPPGISESGEPNEDAKNQPDEVPGLLNLESFVRSVPPSANVTPDKVKASPRGEYNADKYANSPPQGPSKRSDEEIDLLA